MEASIPPLRKEQIELVLTINVSIDIVSLLCSLFAILALSVLCPYAKGQTNRVSIRLLIYIAFMDAMYTAFQIVSYKLVSDSFLCSFSVWALVYFTLASVFLRLAVVINIQLAVVKSAKNATITEYHYLLVATIFPLLLSIAPACANLFGWTIHEGTCWFRDDGKDKNFIWQWFSYYMWVVFSVLYSIITILLIVRYLRKQKSEIQEDMEAAVPRIPLECNPLPASQSPGLIKQTVYRTCWYPIIPTISQSFVMVNALILTARKEIIFPVYLIAITGTALQGTLTAIVFANDPAVEEASVHFQKYLVKKYYYDYEQAQHLPPKGQGRKGSIASLLSNGSSHETATVSSSHSPGFTSEGGVKTNQMVTIESNPITKTSSSWLSHLMYRIVKKTLVREKLNSLNEINANSNRQNLCIAE